MLVQNSKYPEFVADQLLTSDNLNDLFGYLDEQGRITRTNLIGIGIVCGLEVKTAADGSSITITKGTGVTSEGYMVTIPETTYTDYIDYDSLQEEYYEKFVNTGSKTKKFEHLWELKQAGVENSTKLTNNFLNGNGNSADKKVVLLFVELLKVGNKNCNPNSCDDKGITIEITIRPLLARKADVDSFTLKTGTEYASLNQSYISLEEKRIRRLDVTNTNIATTADVFTAYKKILTQQFLNDTENLLTGAWNVFYQVIGSEYNNVNPFNGLASAFAFLHNGSLNSNSIIYMQYYYDHFSDLLAAYDEFRIAGMEILSMCCPDSSLFPRHLLLDLAIKDGSINYSQYRHYFIYSPLFQQKGLVNKLKLLFRRMVLMRTNFSIPAISGINNNPDNFLRVTPSRLDASPISYKAIPYYYMVNNGVMPLFQHWSYEKTIVSAADKNLSYHASSYSGKDFVVNPLLFDLEPYNFLRIEGIIGKQYSHVIRNLKRQIYSRRLPTDVIAISTDNTDYDISTILTDLKSISRIEEVLTEDLGLIHCHFNDLESVYISIKNEMLCTLCKELRYYYEIPINLAGFDRSKESAVAVNEAFASEASLFSSCSDKQYMVQPNTFGVIIEKIYKQVGDTGEVTLTEILEALGIDITEDKDGDGQPDIQITPAVITAFMLMMPILEIPVYIIRLSKYFTDDLHDFDVEGYCKLQTLIAKKIKGYKTGSSLISNTQKTEIKDAVSNDSSISKLKLMDDTGAEATAGNEKTETTGGMKINTNMESLSGSRSLTTGFSSLANIQNGLGFILLYILVLEDLFDHLDVLAYNCKCKALRGLKEEYLRRIAELAELRQLRHFNQRHPGMQHKAGVTMGGTFIIIYHSPEAERTISNIRGIAERSFLKGIVEKKTSKKISEKELDKNILRLIQVLKKQDITVIEFVKYIEKSKLDVEEVIEIIREIDPSLLNNIKGIKEILAGDKDEEDNDVIEASNNLKEGTVIADFYLPYLCYSCCPPIVYQVQDVQEEPVDVFFSLQPNPKTNSNIYSITDDNEYSFTTSPKGGTINNGSEQNGVFAKGDEFVFVPSKIAELLGSKEKVELSFTYAYDGVTSETVTVTVYNIPAADIIIEPNEMPQAPGTTFKISSKTKFADKFTWLIDSKEISGDEHLGEQSFKEPGSYKISLSVTQSATGTTAQANDATIEIVEGPTAVITSKPTITSAIATGSTVHFEADVNNADIYSWQVNNKEISNEKELPEQKFDKAGTFVYKLVVTQKATGQSITSNSITVVVAAEPKASIITSPTVIPNLVQPGTSIVFNGSVQNADVFSWELKNAAGEVLQQSSKQNLGAILFSDPGSYEVTLVVKQSTTGKSATATPVKINVDKLQVEMSANIRLNPATIGTNHPVGTKLNFTSDTSNVDTFVWFQNGNPIAGASSPELQGHPFNEAGTYFISLRGKNSSTGQTVTSNTVQINIFKSEEPTDPTGINTCGELNEVSAAFLGLKSADSANYSQFHEMFLIKTGIATYFEQLVEIATAPRDVQIEFFEENITLGVTVEVNLRRWIVTMGDIVINDQQKAFHFLASAMYRILLRLSMYISCIQKGDVNEANVKISPTLESTLKQLPVIIEKLGNRTQTVKDQVNTIPKDVTKELQRMNSSGSATEKPTYGKLLETIFSLFK